MIAYLDCFAGASGDMILAALIDAGADLDAVTDQLSRMELPGEITLSDVQRCGIRATRLQVEGPDEPFVSSYGQGR
ncbi:MAG: nickel insertion protein, partial [Actinomycetota bacterium]